MRPSVLVTAVKAIVGEVAQVRVQIMCGAGRPVVVSRTWQVMGSLVAMVVGGK